MESNVRKAGAIPATIGIIGGRVKIGLEPRELGYLADVENNLAVVKVSRRDIGPAIALKRDGVETFLHDVIGNIDIRLRARRAVLH